MLGGKNTKPLGYTIVEIMVVLAVSGVMFLIAATFINGKQAKAAFTAGVNETSSELQDLIEQVNDGRYSDIPQTCQYNGSISFPGSATKQGENSTCVFLGKVLHFTGGANPPYNNYEVASIAGGRINPSTGQPITDVGSASPTIIPDLTIDKQVPQQLDVSQVTVTDTDNSVFSTLALGFMQSQGSISSSGNLRSGAQTISLYALKGSPGNKGSALSTLGDLRPVSSADICLGDGTRKADIGVGTDNSSQLNVNITIGTTTQCP
ncbi:MAG TPA: prepilin-type N-terminal cleavage/methylation domain-containing protein [Candidatus Saccharimonadia bacterium]|nr:prepilin-type N-terminal cleavage/methylation domain-containing protein [Candidatus Saccharimonadia bacterium]